MKMKKWAIAATLMILSNLAMAGNFDEGMRYYITGKPVEALSIWKPLAEGGDKNAQYHIGHMYSNGQGVAKNNEEALKWYSLAASQGHETAPHRIRVLKLEMKILK